MVDYFSSARRQPKHIIRGSERANVIGGPTVHDLRHSLHSARTELARMLSIDGPEDFEADAVFSAAIARVDRVPAQA